MTITDFSNKMKRYLLKSESSVYGNQYLKLKLQKQYGDSILVSEGEGLHDIVTFQGTTQNSAELLQEAKTRATRTQKKKKKILQKQQ